MSEDTTSSPDAPNPVSGDTAESIGGAYTVLARKYRPQNFDDLIGQDAMVRTLRNAFATGRIAQAYMLTGVRGVGKTTTARILARALNYQSDGTDGPTIDIPALGDHCSRIMASNHPDVLEMDAASHTGIDDIREIIESARYKPLSARMKVYIIDEVHMLSKAAFNGLLKTLEEPPDHVRFIFATTEIRKVPVTVLSRCQRFDLRRVDVLELAKHFSRVAEAEGLPIDEAAVMLIARAAEGSVRDGLSLLDQTMAAASAKITSEDVRALLGLADRMRVFELLEAALGGDAGDALGRLDALHADGAEPIQIMADLAEAVHGVTRIKAAGVEAGDAAMSESERAKAEELAKKLSIPVLARAWQMLLKGHSEVQAAPRPRIAAEMLLVRMCYLADLPTPGDLARVPAGDVATNAGGARDTRAPGQFSGEQATALQVRSEPVAVEEAVALPQPQTLEEIVALAEQDRDLMLRRALSEQVRPVRVSPGQVEIRLLEGAPRTLANDLAKKLEAWTGQRWMVAVSDEEGGKTIGEVRREREAEELATIKQHASVRAVLERFPEAEITAVRPTAPEDKD